MNFDAAPKIHAVPVAPPTITTHLEATEKTMTLALTQADEILRRLLGERPDGAEDCQEANQSAPSLDDLAHILAGKAGQLQSALSLIARTIG